MTMGETHTQGPLKAEIGTEDDPNRWAVLSDPDGYLVATIENGQPRDTLETEKATAHLFAAAPELLEACKLLLVEVQASGNATAKDFGWEKAVSAARDAIAKADPKP